MQVKDAAHQVCLRLLNDSHRARGACCWNLRSGAGSRHGGGGLRLGGGGLRLRGSSDSLQPPQVYQHRCFAPVYSPKVDFLKEVPIL